MAQTVKNPCANSGDWGLIPASGRSPGGGHGNPHQYSCLENPMEPGGLQFMGWQRVGHDWVANTHTHTHTHTYCIMPSVWSNAISKFRTLVHCWWNYKAELTWEASFQIVYFTFLIFLFLYSFCPHWSQWQHSGLSIFITGRGIFSCGMWTLGCSMWDLAPWPGIEPRPPALGECGVLATGPPEESLRSFKSPQCAGCLRSVGM